jgi:hypothetical protein
VLILFDQGTPVGIRSALREHTVRTAHQQGWSRLANGDLLSAAVKSGFEVLLTTDKNLVHQQDLSKYKIAVIVLGRSKWRLLKKRLGEISAAVNSVKSGTYTLLEIPE